ncbi:MAG: Spy/CpxP family protein refolding chaperone [Dongiaceae bacterium]
MPKRFPLLLLAGAGLAAAAFTALPQISPSAVADTGAAYDGGPDGPGGPRHRGPMLRQMCDSTEARTAAILAYARTKLGITGDENAAWDKFAAAVQASNEPVKQACAAMPKPDREHPPKLTERLAAMDSMLSARSEQLHRVRAAVEQLYPTLSADQQRTADRLMPGARGVW